MTTSRMVGVGFCLTVGLSLLTTRPFQAAKPSTGPFRKAGMSDLGGQGEHLCGRSAEEKLFRIDLAFHPLGERGARGRASWLQLALGETPKTKRATDSKAVPPARMDLYGDPLPSGAVARLGTVRFRHISGANCIAWTRDGKEVISASGSEVLLWNASTGKLSRRFPVQRPYPEVPHIGGGPATSIAVSPDGRYLALGFRDNRTQVWDLGSGKLVRALGEPPKDSCTLRFRADSKTLMVVEGTQRIRCWNVEQGNELRRGTLPKLDWPCRALGTDGMLAVADNDLVVLWDTANGKVIRQFRVGDKLPINTLVFSPDGRTLASSADQGNTCLWEVFSGKRLRQLPPTQTGSNCLSGAFSADSHFFAVQVSQSLRIWDLRTGREFPRIPLPDDCSSSPVLSPDGKVVAVNHGSIVALWEVATGKPVQSRPGHRGSVRALVFSPDGKCLASAGFSIRLWDVAKGTQLRCIGPTYGVVTTLAFTPDGRLLVGGGCEFRVWERAAGKEIRHFAGHTNLVDQVSVSPDGKLVASVSTDRTLRLWGLATGKEVWKCKEFDKCPKTVAFSPDGKRLASGGDDAMVRLWEVSTGKELRQIKLPLEAQQSIPDVRCVVFSPDGKYLASASGDGWVHVWDLRIGSVYRSFAAPCGNRYRLPVKALAISPDGRTLVSAGEDGVVRLWEVLTGKERHLIDHYATAIAFAPDGRTLASAGALDTTVLLWDVAECARGGTAGPKSLTLAHLQACWNDLGSADAKRAFHAIGYLVAAPSQTVPFLADRLRPLNARRIWALIADLDHSRFSIREKAFRELAAHGKSAEPALRQALAGQPTLEKRRRVERLLEKLAIPLTSEGLRRARAVEVLEFLNTRQANRVLEMLKFRQWRQRS